MAEQLVVHRNYDETEDSGLSWPRIIGIAFVIALHLAALMLLLIPAVAPKAEVEKERNILVTLVDAVNRIVAKDEVRMRTALRVYLDTWIQNRSRGGANPPVREGRRMRWLDRALEPARGRLTAREWRRLRSALALTLSIDALVVMKDVCHLDEVISCRTGPVVGVEVRPDRSVVALDDGHE